MKSKKIEEIKEIEKNLPFKVEFKLYLHLENKEDYEKSELGYEPDLKTLKVDQFKKCKESFGADFGYDDFNEYSEIIFDNLEKKAITLAIALLSTPSEKINKLSINDLKIVENAVIKSIDKSFKEIKKTSIEELLKDKAIDKNIDSIVQKNSNSKGKTAKASKDSNSIEELINILKSQKNDVIKMMDNDLNDLKKEYKNIDDEIQELWERMKKLILENLSD